MKRNCELRTAALAALFLAGLCVPGHSAPTPEQRAERTNLLIQAIDNNNVEQAKACIKLGADANATVTDKYGDTRPILIHAIDKKNKEIAELLIKAGANVNATTDDYGWTALMFAASNETKDIAELLIKAGADVNAKTDYDQTVLMFAASNKTKDIAELLIKAGADVNAKALDIEFAKDENDKLPGSNALMYAAGLGNKDLVELLIKSGSDVNATNWDGVTALYWAIAGYARPPIPLVHLWMTEAEVADIKTNLRLTAEMLVKAGADIDTVFIHTIKHRINDTMTRNNVTEPYLNEAMVKLFIDLGADVNSTDSEGISVLTYAALYGRNDIVELLKAAGARE